MNLSNNLAINIGGKILAPHIKDIASNKRNYTRFLGKNKGSNLHKITTTAIKSYDLSKANLDNKKAMKERAKVRKDLIKSGRKLIKSFSELDNCINFSIIKDASEIAAIGLKYAGKNSKDKKDRIYLTKVTKDGKVKYKRDLLGRKRYITKTNMQKLGENLENASDALDEFKDAISSLKPKAKKPVTKYTYIPGRGYIPVE
jgi:hypothetical protein